MKQFVNNEQLHVNYGVCKKTGFSNSASLMAHSTGLLRALPQCSEGCENSDEAVLHSQMTLVALLWHY